MIQAVVFDCFGVLAYDGWLAYCDKYFDDKPDSLEQAIVSNRKVDAGLISYEDFVTDVAQLAGISETEARATLERNPPNEKLFAFIQSKLKPIYKIGMLSNAGANWLPDIFEQEQIDLFDEVVLSYQLGAIKPDPIMYQTVAARLGVAPEDCIFIDDQPRYVDAAVQQGMKGIRFETTTQVIKNITELTNA